MAHNPYLYILVMAVVTYLIRALPLTLIRKPIENETVRSFLFYLPYVTLAVMTFPAVLSVTENTGAALAGFAVAVLLAYVGAGLLKTSIGACLVVFGIEMLIR